MNRYMSPSRENQLKILVTDDEKRWLEELAEDAGQSVADFLRAFILAAHVEKERRDKQMPSETTTLSNEEAWLYRRIQRGGPLGEALSIERIDHDARVKFGDEIMFTLGENLKKLREIGLVRRAGDDNRSYEALRRDAHLRLSYKTTSRTQKLHQYELSATLKNVSDRRFDDWYIEVELPTPLLTPQTSFSALVADRSDAARSLFRTSSKLPPVLSGDTYSFKLPYRMDEVTYREHKDVLKRWGATARAYVGGEIIAEAELHEVQNF